jgi:hypothetical protein
MEEENIHSHDKIINNKNKTTKNDINTTRVISNLDEINIDDIADNNIMNDAIAVNTVNDEQFLSNNDNSDKNLQESIQDNKKCYLCKKLFDKNNSVLWVSCEKCTNWYCGSCEDNHDLNDSYYCTDCLESRIPQKDFLPSKTSSPITDAPRNDLIRIVRQRQKRAREDMLETNNKKKKIDYEIENKVTVLSMQPDKLVGDVRRVPAVIIGKSGTRDIFYELLTSFGILNVKYRASDLEIYYGDIKIPEDVKNKKISLREATKLFNNHPKKNIDQSKIHCKCSGKCFQDRRCVCFKNGKTCSSHCENHLSGKKCKCLNIEKGK